MTCDSLTPVILCATVFNINRFVFALKASLPSMTKILKVEFYFRVIKFYAQWHGNFYCATTFKLKLLQFPIEKHNCITEISGFIAIVPNVFR